MENEKRLISADVAKEMIVNHANEFSDVLNRREKALLIGGGTSCIDKCPTVDAVEVVHAYWTGSRFNPMTDEYEEYCSHCCAWSSEYGKPYCPNCGAKMDGGTEDV